MPSRPKPSWVDTRAMPPPKTLRNGANDLSKRRSELPEEQLVHLKSYKYQSVDKSWISNHILRHYWNFMVELLPLWLAPNAVTLLGFGFIVGNVCLLEAYIPDLVGPAPSWVYYSFAFGLWAYSTMDNIDGKQARRTGSSSPLGELFDHGIDSLNCTLASLLETASMGLGATPAGAFTALIPCLPMFFSTWETYHTHVLYLGYFNGPTEGLIIACLLMIVSGLFGPQIFSLPMRETLGDWVPYGHLNFLDVWIPIISGAFIFAHLPGCVLNVIAARRKANLPILPVFLEWTPIIVFTSAICAWLGSPNTSLLSENRLVLFCVTLSFVFGRMTTKIILAHLTKQPFPYWTVLLLPLVGGAVLANLHVLGLPAISAEFELLYLRSYLIFAIIAYSRWAVLVINSICGYLGIKCLKITPKRTYIPMNAAGGRKQRSA
ncbi:CDP-alcohol phosphatidyltransferase-domain-containing protein [Pyronema omphalodes]|nr:CDP-alcohol phosphatidyltransferase-domain-containing protein [Pyronema omphalodes]